MMKNIKKKKGFTLIELIIVIAIIGILAAIAVPKFGNIQVDSKRKADFANAKVIADATLMAINNDVKFTTATAPTTTEIAAYLPQFPKPQLISGTFVIAVAADESVTVTVDSDKVQTVASTELTADSAFILYPVQATKVAPYNK